MLLEVEVAAEGQVVAAGGAVARRPARRGPTVRSGSWLTLARGLPLPPWLTRSSRCAVNE